MHLTITFIILLAVASIVSAAPKEVAKQKEADWRDGRYANIKFGPFVSGHIATPKGGTHKGVAIRVGEKSENTMVFDTDLCSWRAGWTGGFLKTDPTRYGLIRALKPEGAIVFANSPAPGVADSKGSFADPRSPKYGPLSRNWVRFKGLYVNGGGVVVQYEAGGASVYERVYLGGDEKNSIMSRRILVKGNKRGAQIQLANIPGAKWEIHKELDSSGLKFVARLKRPLTANRKKEGMRNEIGVTAGELKVTAKGVLAVSLSPQEKDVELLVQHLKGDEVGGGLIAQCRKALGAPVLAHGPRRWGEPIATKGIVDRRKVPFAIDTITVPYKNPHNALFFTAGHDFTSNGDCYVATAHGDVWKVTGIDAELKELKWHRFATGLYQPLGLRVVKDQVYVLGRDQITRLHDKNGDGEVDFYEAFNNDIMIGGGGHSYATCLETDPEGNFYFIRCAEGTPHGGVVLKVAADGSKLEVVATGFRNPNGLGVGPNGVITAADQQGTWVPETRLDVIKTGGFYGFMPMHKRKVVPKTYDPPLVWIPRILDNSAGGQVWVPKGAWGPLGGELLHFSYGRCTMMHIVRDGANGGVVPLAGRFLSGACRGRFNPKDGHLYVTGLLGWQTSAIRDGCLQRVRYTGEPIHQPTGMKVHANGIRLTFSTPLDKKIAEDIDSWSAEQWSYKWSSQYGSKDWSVKNPGKQGRDPVTIQSAKFLPDGKSVFLQMDKVQPVHSMAIKYNLDTVTGKIMRGEYFLTINQVGAAYR